MRYGETNLYITTPTFDARKADSDLMNYQKRSQCCSNIKEIAQTEKSLQVPTFGTTLDPLNWLRLQAKYIVRGFRSTNK